MGFGDAAWATRMSGYRSGREEVGQIEGLVRQFGLHSVRVLGLKENEPLGVVEVDGRHEQRQRPHDERYSTGTGVQPQGADMAPQNQFPQSRPGWRDPTLPA